MDSRTTRRTILKATGAAALLPAMAETAGAAENVPHGMPQEGRDTPKPDGRPSQ
jgi:hypothetical protein